MTPQEEQALREQCRKEAEEACVDPTMFEYPDVHHWKVDLYAMGQARAAYAAALYSERSKARWIPVEEALPEIGEKVQVWCEGEQEVWQYDDWNKMWTNGTITHWRPLPDQPPQTEQP